LHILFQSGFKSVAAIYTFVVVTFQLFANFPFKRQFWAFLVTVSIVTLNRKTKAPSCSYYCKWND